MRKLILFAFLLSYFVSQNAMAQIVITEISYNPPESGNDSTEYIELYNSGASAVNLNGYSFVQGVSYIFPSVTINAGDFIVMSVDSVAIQNTFGISTLEWTSGSLSNNGEDIVLKDAMGITVDSVDYDDNSPWPVGPPDPDGGGPSIELTSTALDNNLASSWGISTTPVPGVVVNGNQVYGTPGAFAASSSQLSTTVSGIDITCHGLMNGSAKVNTTGGVPPYTYSWSPGMVVGQGTDSISSLSRGLYIVTVTDFNGTTAADTVDIIEPDPLKLSFLVRNLGFVGGVNGEIDLTVTGGTPFYSYLWTNPIYTTGLIIEDLQLLPLGTYHIRVTDRNNCIVRDSVTITNPGPPAKLIITEINYNGPESGTDSTEYVEIMNAGTSMVNMSSYQFLEGVRHTFTLQDTLSPGRYFVVAGNASGFRNRYGFDADAIWRWGSLINSGEDITLIDNSIRTLDSVDYKNSSPWPSGSLAGQANGGGASIELIDTALNNNLGGSWRASLTSVAGQVVNGFQVYGTPGSGPFVVGVSETDLVDGSLLIYPNPSKGLFIIEAGAELKNTHLQIISLEGKVLRDEVVNQSKTNIDMRNFSNGVYFIRVGGITKKVLLNQ